MPPAARRRTLAALARLTRMRMEGNLPAGVNPNWEPGTYWPSFLCWLGWHYYCTDARNIWMGADTDDITYVVRCAGCGGLDIRSSGPTDYDPI